MPTWFAIVAYKCEVNGTPVGSIDIRVLGFDFEFEDQVRSAILDQPVNSYSNHLGEQVTWTLVEILAVEKFLNHSNGDEIIGFIAEPSQFQNWAFDRAT